MVPSVKPPQILKNRWNSKGYPSFVVHRSVEGTVRLRLVRPRGKFGTHARIPCHTYFAHGAVRVAQICFVRVGFQLQFPYIVKEFHRIPIQIIFGFLAAVRRIRAHTAGAYRRIPGGVLFFVTD